MSLRTNVAFLLVEPLAKVLSVSWLSPVEVINVDGLLLRLSVVLWFWFRGCLGLFFSLCWLRLFWFRRFFKLHKLIVGLSFLLAPYA